MRYVLLFIAVLLVLISVFPSAAAEEWPLWADSPSLVPPALGQPCSLLSQSRGGLSFYAGYMDYGKGFNLAVDPTTDGYGPLILLESWQQNYPLRGLWLSLAADLPLTAGLGVTLSGSYLFPSVVSSEEFVYWAFARGSRTWSTSTQWCTLDAAGTYRASEATQLLGGVRYDAFATKFFNPSNTVNLAALSTDEADVRITAVMPYVGVAVAQGSNEGMAKARLLGFPLVPGEARYGETYGIGPGAGSRNEVKGSLNRGYFLELSAEAVRGYNSGRMAFGVFGKYHHVKLQGDFPGNYYSVGFPTQSDKFQFNVLRQAWVVGAVASFGFTSPF